MASEEAKFVARAERLAGPQNRYVVPEFEEKTPYGYKRQNPYTRLFDDRIIFMGVQVDDTTADRLVDQHAGVRQDQALALGARREQDGRGRRRLAEAYGLHIEVDTFLTAQEAKDYGIVDEVLQPRGGKQ